MGLFSKDIKSMDDLMLHELQDIYYAENQIIKALPKLIEKATNRDLKQALTSHLSETKKQVKWPAPGFEDTELGVLLEPEVAHGEAEVYAGVQA